MNTATIHHLPGCKADAEKIRDLDAQAKTLTPGQWVRVIWHNKDDGTRGVIEGTLRKPTHLRDSLFVGATTSAFCLTIHGLVNADVTAIETVRRPDLDMDELAERTAAWCDAQLAFEQAPVGRFQTGDRTLEENAMLVAEDYVRAYLRGVKV